LNSKRAVGPEGARAKNALRTLTNLSSRAPTTPAANTNPNTVVRAYRELEHEGFVEIRHGSGAFVTQTAARRPKISPRTQAIMRSAVERLAEAGLGEDEIRRLLESELAQIRVEVSGRIK
jgi:DNA-binding transcriptional regulator YhcF (GntR family)